MIESTLRQSVVKMLKPLHAVSVENPAHPGTPDVNYIGGWIELKALNKWPRSQFHIPHFSPQQRVWLTNRSRMGGRCHMLITIGREWLVLEGGLAARIIGHCTNEEVLTAAMGHWVRTPTAKELISCLSHI